MSIALRRHRKKTAKRWGGGASVLRIVADISRKHNLSQCDGVRNMENGMLDRLIWTAGPNNTRIKTKFAIRYEQIRELIRLRASSDGL